MRNLFAAFFWCLVAGGWVATVMSGWYSVPAIYVIGCAGCAVYALIDASVYLRREVERWFR